MLIGFLPCNPIISINLENFLDQLALYIKKNINSIDLRECYSNSIQN